MESKTISVRFLRLRARWLHVLIKPCSRTMQGSLAALLTDYSFRSEFGLNFIPKELSIRTPGDPHTWIDP